MADKPDGKGGERGTTAIVSVLLLYLGAYYATVVPYPRHHLTGMGPWHFYRIGDRHLPDATHTFFAPAHWIDRQIRPGTWWMREEW